MKEKVDIEIETFVHGAMCIAYQWKMHTFESYDCPRFKPRWMLSILSLGL